MNDTVTQLHVPNDTIEGISNVVVAIVVGESDDKRPLVCWGTRQRQTWAARSVWMKHAPKWSSCRGSRVVIGFEEGDETKPIVLGLLDSPPNTETLPVEPAAQTDSTCDDKPKVLRIESQQELILECGQAKIALRADGRIVILGGYVLSRSKGVNKIKGGSVQIN